MTTRRNLITDVPGLAVGHAHDERIATGVTAVVFDRPTVTSASILGGGPATRDTDCLEPHAVVPGVDALVLGGGSGFGLDAASGVQAYLREAGRGFAVGPFRVPVVPQAIVFDLMNGGDKAWGRYPPYRELGYEAATRAGSDFRLGTAGGGYGATTVDLKGGLGSASAVTSCGLTVGALAIANAISSVVIGRGPHFWAGAFEVGDEFGGLGLPPRVTEADRRLAWKGGPGPCGHRHDARPDRHRRRARQGPVQAPRRHGAYGDRQGAALLPRAAGRRRGLRLRHGPHAPPGRGRPDDRALRRGLRLRGSRHRPRGLRGDGPPVRPGASGLAGPVRGVEGLRSPSRKGEGSASRAPSTRILASLAAPRG
jgi:hypothetical protein